MELTRRFSSSWGAPGVWTHVNGTRETVIDDAPFVSLPHRIRIFLGAKIRIPVGQLRLFQSVRRQNGQRLEALPPALPQSSTFAKKKKPQVRPAS